MKFVAGFSRFQTFCTWLSELDNLPPLNESLAKWEGVTLGLEQWWHTLLRLGEGPTFPKNKANPPITKPGSEMQSEWHWVGHKQCLPQEETSLYLQERQQNAKAQFHLCLNLSQLQPYHPPPDISPWLLRFRIGTGIWCLLWFQEDYVGVRMYGGCLVNICWSIKKEWWKRNLRCWKRDMERDVQKKRV